MAASTLKTYQCGAKKFIEFCEITQTPLLLPASQHTLCLFISFLARSGLSYATINSYLSALRYLHIINGVPEPKQELLPKFLLVKRGIRKEKAKCHQQKPRLPITPQILRHIKALWLTQQIDHDTVMLWAACCLCFFGFFRLGEITCSTESSFDKDSDLAISDLALDNHTHPSFIVVKLKQSKTDQFRKGAQIVVGRTDNDLCPVAALLHFISIRGTAEGPLFRFQNGKFLTKSNFIPHIRRALSTLGYDSHHYAGHSFRIGAASTAAKANLEDSMIRTLGRWESDAFLSYIRTPASQLAGISRTLSLVP